MNLFLCRTKRCWLLRERCIQRQDAAADGKAWKKGRSQELYRSCGDCDQGREERARHMTLIETVGTQESLAVAAAPLRGPAQETAGASANPSPPTPPRASASKETNVSRTCANGCGRRLRKDSVGEQCSYCRAGKAPKARPQPEAVDVVPAARKVIGKKAQKAFRAHDQAFTPPPPLPIELPEIANLPDSYLAECVGEARRRLSTLKQVLGEAA